MTSSEVRSHFFSPRTENRLLVKWERTGIDAQASVMGDRDLRFVDHSKRERAIISTNNTASVGIENSDGPVGVSGLKGANSGPRFVSSVGLNSISGVVFEKSTTCVR